MNVLVVGRDRIFLEDELQWGLWEKDAETGEFVMRLYGPDSRPTVVEYAHMFVDSVERLTGVLPTLEVSQP
jgi:hypothetical protein